MTTHPPTNAAPNRERPRLVIATGNAGKLREFREGLAPLDARLLSATDVGLGEAPAETGDSYEANARIKAVHAARRGGLPALADDSGLEVDALGGAPGVFSARFGGARTPEERIAHLLARLEGVPDGERGAAFRCCLVLATPDGELRSFHGECRGRILRSPHGGGGFGYDPVFHSTDLGRSFAEASAADKRRVSHRGRAIAAFLAWARTPEAAPLLAGGRGG